MHKLILINEPHFFLLVNKVMDNFFCKSKLVYTQIEIKTFEIFYEREL